MITCSRCRKRKQHTEFYKQKIGKHGRRSTCIECDRIYARSRIRVLNKELRELVFTHYGGYVCACCGERERKFLTLDHVNNDGNAHRKATGRNAGVFTYQWIVQNNFPPGFQILCMNCNFGKSLNGGVCPHQARSNDYPAKGVGPSGPKRSASQRDDDIVWSAAEDAAAQEEKWVDPQLLLWAGSD